MSDKRNLLFPAAQHPLLFGHRGCSHAAPENTLAAFQKVLDLGVPGVELDVHLCKSGELVVTHDSNLKRVTGVDIEVEEAEYAQIAELDAGAWFGAEYTGQRVPLFDEVLDLLSGKVYFDIEIKHWNKEGGALERKLVEAVRKRNILDQVMIYSFNPYAIRAVRGIDPTIHTAHIYTDYFEFPRWLRNGWGRFVSHPHVLKPDRDKVTRWTIFFKQKVEGYPLITWTEDDEEKAQRFLTMGVDGIISNVPERLLPVFREHWTS